METLERFLLLSAIVLFVYFFYKWLLQYLRRKEINGSYPYVHPFESPISSNTKICFELKVTGQVRGELFDWKGEIVKGIFDDKCGAGYHEIDMSFENIPNGMYELVLYFSNQTTRRMIELKA